MILQGQLCGIFWEHVMQINDYKCFFSLTGSQFLYCFIPSRDNVKAISPSFGHLAPMETFSLQNTERNFSKAISFSSFALVKTVAHESGSFPAGLILNNTGPLCPHILSPTRFWRHSKCSCWDIMTRERTWVVEDRQGFIWFQVTNSSYAIHVLGWGNSPRASSKFMAFSDWLSRCHS